MTSGEAEAAAWVAAVAAMVEQILEGGNAPGGVVETPGRDDTERLLGASSAGSRPSPTRTRCWRRRPGAGWTDTP